MTEHPDPVETLAGVNLTETRNAEQRLIAALFDANHRGRDGQVYTATNVAHIVLDLLPALVAEAVAQEREACAKVADQAACELEAINPFLPSAVSLGKDIAAAIRARTP